MPNHERIKGSTLRIICTQVKIPVRILYTPMNNREL